MVKKLFLSCFIITTGPIMAQQTPFLDPMFSVVDLENGQLSTTSSNNNIVYGTGLINGSAAGEMQLQLDLYHPTGTGLPARSPGVIFIHGGGFWSGSEMTVFYQQLLTRIRISNRLQAFKASNYYHDNFLY